MTRYELLERNIDKLKTRLGKYNEKSNQLSWTRLVIILFSVLVTVIALFFSNELLSGLAVFIFLFVFGIASFIHHRFKQSIRRYQLWQSIKIEHLNRAALNWVGIPQKNYTIDSHHPFAIDLDIIGKNSLHRLIDNTTSLDASECILSWLLNQNLSHSRLLF